MTKVGKMGCWGGLGSRAGYFGPHPIGPIAVTWPHLDANGAGKCSPWLEGEHRFTDLQIRGRELAGPQWPFLAPGHLCQLFFTLLTLLHFLIENFTDEEAEVW